LSASLPAASSPRLLVGARGGFEVLNLAGRSVAIAGVAVLSAIAAAGMALAIYAAWLFHDLPDAAALAEYRPPTSTRVYAWDGTLIGEFGQERRIFVPYAQLPPLMMRAFLTAEDRKFYEHGGIDMMGVARALIRDVAALAKGERLQGGSTITQQVAKNVLLTSDVSFGRKIKEAILARRLEETLTKNRILELYLNEIWLGYRSYGVGAAAYNYFGKPLNQLTLSEAAYLAALPKGPDNYHPVRRKANAIGRRNQIIKDMAQLGFVSRAAADAAMREDLVVQSAPRRAQYRDADYFLSEVRRRAFATLGEERVEGGGLYMRTTLDSRLQTAARVALMRGLESYDRRHGWRGGWGNVEIKAGWEDEARSQSPPSERRDWRAAVVDEVSGSAVTVRFADGGGGPLEGADVAWARAGAGLKHGDLIFVEPTSGGRYGLRQVPDVNGAIVAIEPRSGRVLAMVGGYSFSLSNFNRATQAMRQPGSAFKPFVYATALENGFSPASVVTDAPLSFRDTAGNIWAPENYSRRFYGPTVLRNGLVYSRNVMTVRIAQTVGMKKIVDDAVKAGVAGHVAGGRRDHALQADGRLFGLRQWRAPDRAAPDRDGGRPPGQDRVAFRAAGLPAMQRTLRRRGIASHSRGRDPDHGSDHRLSDHHHAPGRGAAGHGGGGVVTRAAHGGQDRNHQRVSQRLVRRLHAEPGGRRLHRLRRQPQPWFWRDRHLGRGAHLHGLHARRPARPARGGLQAAQGYEIRPGRRAPRGFPAGHRTAAGGRGRHPFGARSL
jgi:hypothetical protein